MKTYVSTGDVHDGTDTDRFPYGTGLDNITPTDKKGTPLKKSTWIDDLKYGFYNVMKSVGIDPDGKDEDMKHSQFHDAMCLMTVITQPIPLMMPPHPDMRLLELNGQEIDLSEQRFKMLKECVDKAKLVAGYTGFVDMSVYKDDIHFNCFGVKSADENFLKLPNWQDDTVLIHNTKVSEMCKTRKSKLINHTHTGNTGKLTIPAHTGTTDKRIIPINSKANHGRSDQSWLLSPWGFTLFNFPGNSDFNIAIKDVVGINPSVIEDTSRINDSDTDGQDRYDKIFKVNSQLAAQGQVVFNPTNVKIESKTHDKVVMLDTLGIAEGDKSDDEKIIPPGRNTKFYMSF